MTSTTPAMPAKFRRHNSHPYCGFVKFKYPSHPRVTTMIGVATIASNIGEDKGAMPKKDRVLTIHVAIKTQPAKVATASPRACKKLLASVEADRKSVG